MASLASSVDRPKLPLRFFLNTKLTSTATVESARFPGKTCPGAVYLDGVMYLHIQGHRIPDARVKTERLASYLMLGKNNCD